MLKVRFKKKYYFFISLGTRNLLCLIAIARAKVCRFAWYPLIVVLAVIVAVLLAVIVLIQESKGGSLVSSVAGANSVLGVRKPTDFVEKATRNLAGILVVLAVASSFFVNRGAVTADDLVNDMRTSAPAPQLPGQAPAAVGAAAADAPAK